MPPIELENGEWWMGAAIVASLAISFLYTVFVFLVARAIGHDDFPRRKAWIFYLFFLCGSALAAAGVALAPFPVAIGYKIAAGVCVWFMHAPPSCLGFSVGLEDAARRDAAARYWKTQELLSQWEDEHSEGSLGSSE